MLENMQGDFGIPGIEEDSDKVFDRLDPRQETCSYVEVWLDYESPSHYSIDKPLIYRFYLGKDTNSLDVERNCHYHITIIPEDDGLTEDSWRVDKTGIQEKDQDIFFEMIPSGYLQGTVGETVHVMCRFQPEDAEFDIGLEELEEDRQRGLYDYIIDEDGHGVRLILTGPGTGIVYMEAGEPVNEAAMWVVEVNMPSKTLETATDSSQYMSPCMTSTAQESPQRPGVRLHHLPQDRDRSPNRQHGSHPDYVLRRLWNVPWTKGHQMI